VKHPFVWGAVVGIGGLLAWHNRGRIVALARRLRHPFSGFGSERLLAASGHGDAVVAVRQLKRYTFASMQDQSPIVGLTHASYAMAFMDFLEETVGRDNIRAASFDPAEVRRIIVGLQDSHAERLRACDPYIMKVLELEKQQNGRGFVFADAAGAPTGA
jgi:hypothetical protein